MGQSRKVVKLSVVASPICLILRSILGILGVHASIGHCKGGMCDVHIFAMYGNRCMFSI